MSADSISVRATLLLTPASTSLLPLFPDPSHQKDLFPAIRWQFVPAGDKLAQPEISAGSMQTPGRGVAASAVLRRDLRI
jgi:hypothetical protein